MEILSGIFTHLLRNFYTFIMEFLHIYYGIFTHLLWNFYTFIRPNQEQLQNSVLEPVIPVQRSN